MSTENTVDTVPDAAGDETGALGDETGALGDETVEETDAVAETEVVTDDTSGPTTRPRWRRVAMMSAVGVTVAALGGASAYFHLEHQRAQDTAATRAAVVTAATDGTEAVLSYRASDVEADLAHAATFLTGDFREYYTELGSEAIAPNATARRLTSDATIAGTSTIRVDEGSAGALVFVNQSVTPASGAATTTSTAIRVHLTEVEGRWLIDRFEPI